MADYKVELGIGLNQTQLNQVKQVLESIESQKREVTYDVDFNIKNINKLLEVGKEIDRIKGELKGLSSVDKSKAVMSVDTQSLEKSLGKIHESIKKLRNAFGTVDSKRGVQSLLTTVNHISTALEKVSRQFGELNRNLTNLTSKDFSLNFDFGLGSKKRSPEQITNEIKLLKKEVEEYEKYFQTKFPTGNQLSSSSIGKLINTYGNGQQKSYSIKLLQQMSGIEPSEKQIAAYQEYIRLIKEVASVDNLEFAATNMVQSRLADSSDLIEIRNEANRTKETLKELFSGGINADALSAQLESIVRDLKEINQTLENLSSDASLGGLTQSFDRLSDTLKKLVSNATLVKNALGDGLTNTMGIDTSVTNKIEQESDASTNAVIQNEKKKQQAYQQTINAMQRLDNVDINVTTFADRGLDGTIDRIAKLRTALRNVGFNNSSVDSITKDIDNLGVSVKEVTSLLRGNTITLTVKGLDQYERAVTVMKSFQPDKDGGFTVTNSSTSVTQSLKESEKFIKQQKQAVANLTNQINQLNRAANDKNASRPIKDTSHLDRLKDKYGEVTTAIQKMEAASSNTFVDEQDTVKRLITEYKSLVSEFKNAENVSNKMKGTDFASGLDIAKNDLEKFKAEAKDFPQIVNTIKDLDTAIENVGDSASLNKFTDQLKVARSELAKIKSETSAANRSEKVGINVSGLESKIKDLQRISPEIDKFEAEIDGAKVSVQSLLNDLKQVNTQDDFSVVNARFRAFAESAKAAGIAISETVSKAKSIKNIQFRLNDTGAKGFEQEIKEIDMAVESLESSSAQLITALDSLHSAFNAMNIANEAGDMKQLEAAAEQYEEALKQVNSQLELQKKLKKDAFKADSLKESKISLSSDIDEYLLKNTKLSEELRQKIIALKASLNDLDADGLKLAAQQFNNFKKQIDNFGKSGLTFWDNIKKKFKEYTAYFSVVEVFMYGEQALRSMFEQVRVIDTAMTELKKVTDETEASYNRFLSNAASRAKELGTTIDGLVSSTADFARLGYGFGESQKLAEVANIYAVVGDEIDSVETVTKSLISTMTAFGVEASDSMSIVDKFNAVGNNFAISSGGIGDALERSASSMAAANNTLDETIALITAANTVVQDADAVGTAFKTISMRIRGAKTEMEEAGLDTEGMASSTAKLRQELLALSGVDIMLDATTFKSTYQIMEELANKWEHLTDIQQASVTELIAGKRQGNIVSSLMTNFDIAQNALQTSLNSSGSAMAEHTKYMDSIEAKLSQLKAAWQSFAQTFMSSDVLKAGIDILRELLETLEMLIDNFGVIGTVGLGTGIYTLFKSFQGGKGIIEEAADAIDNVVDIVPLLGKSAGEAAGGVTKLLGSFGKFIGIAGAVAAAIGLIYNAYKNAKEEAAAARQETIENSNAYLEAASEFEQAYIKYSGKTSLTAEEESELQSAIQGTVDALGDKSGALQGIVDNSSDYIASLEAIKNAELKTAKKIAEVKRDAAEESLKEAAIGWGSFDGSEVNVKLGTGKASKVALEMDSDFINTEATSKRFNMQKDKSVTLRLSGEADTKEIIEYYNFLKDYQEELKSEGLDNTSEYKKVEEAIGKMSESIEVYTTGVYEAAKAQYQLTNGIPKTVEEYTKMREAILNSEEISGYSFDTKMGILNNLDSEYSQIFDLSKAEVQARKFVGIIKGYGDGTKDGTNEIGTVETFLNMRTAVNNNECTVGQYLSELDNVKAMTQGWSEEEKQEFNLTFGIDVDSIKKQYDDVYNYISRSYLNNLDTSKYHGFDKELFKEEETKRIKSILNSLTETELIAVANIKAEIDWSNTNTEDILKQIKEEAKLVEALNFEADIEIDTTALETLNTALAESASAMGLSTEAIDSLKAKYSELDGYDASTLFERTANGVKINREELAKLERQYNDLNKSEVQKHLDTLANAYNDVTAEIDKCTNAGERAKLLSKREMYADQIEELATYQAQLEGVTGAYQKWIDAQSGSEDYEGYESIATGRETIEDELSRGFMGNASKAYIDLLSGEDLNGKSVDDYANAWERLDDKVTGAGYSINDFFTVNDDGDITATGIDRFFDSLQTDFKDSVAKFNEETKKWEYDFSQENLKKIQDEWGIGIEAIELLLEAAVSAGYDIDWDGILDGLDLDVSGFETLLSYAESAQKAFNELENIDDVDFNFTATGVEEATSEIEKARSIYLDLITNDDGTINLKAEGAEQMRVMLTTLIIQKQQLSTPAIMSVDTSQLDEAQSKISEVITAAQELQTAYENYEIAISTGIDVEKARGELNDAINSLKETDVGIRADLKLPSNEELVSAAKELGRIDVEANVGMTLDGTSIGALETQIQTQCTPEVIAKVTGIDETAIQNGEGGRQVKYTPEHSEVDAYINSLEDIKKKIIYTYTTEGTKPNPSNIERTITYTYETKGEKPSGTGGVAGTAHINGSAFARGNWGIKGSGVALGGELGQELVVRDGKFFTIGDNGAEFFKYKKNDIVFNATQTESLFKYGGIKGANPRGKMLASGSAFVNGNAFPWSATGSESNFASNRQNSSSSSKKKDEKTTVEETDSWTLTTTKNDDGSTTKHYEIKPAFYEKQHAGGSSGSSKSGSGGGSEDFEETFDWIEIAVDRIERVIDNLDRTVGNVYKSWADRNEALLKQITEVENEITLQQQAYERYMEEAEKVGLDESWAKKVREGEVDITTLTDGGSSTKSTFKGIQLGGGSSDTTKEKSANEILAEKIKEYQEWYEKALDCKDAIDELKQKESELYAQRVENVATRYEGILGVIEHEKNMLEEYISQSEAQAWLVSAKYYDALATNERENISELEKQKTEMLAELQSAMESGTIAQGSEGWYDLCNQIDEVTLAIMESETQLLEYAQTIQELKFEQFDLLQEKISAITEETEFLIDLMSNDKLHDDGGQLTNEGKATMGLHGVNYNVLMHQADLAAEEIKRLEKELEKDPYDTTLEERYREMIALQQEYILSAQDEKNAIRDLVEEGIQLEIEALEERIEKYNEAIDAQKDLYDYQKKVSEQTKNIASLQKQMAAYQGNDSEEAKAKMQELRVSLADAEAELEETEYDKYISDTQQMLDDLTLEYSELLNMRLDNIDALISDMILQINADATSISATLSEKADSVGYTLSNSMSAIWDTNSTKINSVITMYSEKFSNAQTTTNNTLSTINTDLQSIIVKLDKIANANVKSASSSSTTKSVQATAKKTEKPKTETQKAESSKPKVTEDTLMGIASAIWIYGSKAGWGNDPVRSGKLTEKFGLSVAQKVQDYINTYGSSGKLFTFWLKKGMNLDKYKYSAFESGARKIGMNQLAWTQENGREFIVRPSDGAILTPIAKGDGVLTSSASNNIWDMANSPADFIKNNLSLSAANVPSNSNAQSYTQHLDKVIFSFPNVKNYEEMLSAMKEDKNFESLIDSMTIGRLAGKSGLAKGKSIR